MLNLSVLHIGNDADKWYDVRMNEQRGVVMDFVSMVYE
jgi:hypothetical protein